MGALSRYGARVEEINRANGWYDSARSFGDDVALLHSEVSEAFEEFRAGEPLDRNRYVQTGGPLPKPEGVPSELADIFIRLVDTARRCGVDLDAAVEEKLAFNLVRGYRHGGKVV